MSGRLIDLFFMSPPGPSWQLRGRTNFRSAAAAPVDARAAIREWLGLADAIEARGGRVVCLVPPLGTTLTGLPYAAECGHLLAPPAPEPYRFLLPNMASPHRAGERRLWRQVAEALGLIPVDVGGIWEAQGDVASFRGRTMLFFGGRTDRAGVDSARPWFPPDTLRLQVREPAFHGNMALLPLGAADRILVCPDVLADDGMARLEAAFGAAALVPISEEELRAYATNALPLGRSVLAPHLLPARIAALMAGWGLEVVRLPMVELCEKGGGAARCLVSRALVDEQRIALPAAYDYRGQRGQILAWADAP